MGKKEWRRKERGWQRLEFASEEENEKRDESICLPAADKRLMPLIQVPATFERLLEREKKKCHTR